MKLLKLVGVLVGVIALNIIILSPGLLGVDITSSSAFEKSVALTILIISAAVVFYASYIYLFGRTGKVLIREEEPAEDDYYGQVARYRNHKIFSAEVSIAMDQIERMKEKKVALLEVLSQRFQENELSYKRFHSVIVGVEKLFNMNVQGLVNKLRGSELSKLDRIDPRQAERMFSSKVWQQKLQLHKEYTDYVKGYVSSNEEILTKLDRLLLETSLLNSADYRELDEMPGMKEINLLIEQTKYYK